MNTYMMAIDQGTTSTRAILFDHESNMVAVGQKEFTQFFPSPGWVEHDANEIWLSVLSCMAQCIEKAKIEPSQVAGIGITNQRETTVVWNKDTGMPIYKAIVWQSRQTADICNDLKEKGLETKFKEKTGLLIDPYFSGTKIRWILDHVDGAQELAEQGKLLAGTIDTWVIWCLSGGKAHVTDYSNASRTLLFNIYDLKWDEELCEILNIPMSMLPKVKDSSCIYTTTAPYHFFNQEVPIAGIAGDQQAALFGQCCFEEGDAKNTYGTGCFLLMNTGKTPKKSENGLVTTIAWGLNHEVYYALEGSVFVAGSAIQWLRDEMQFFDDSSKSEALALQADEKSEIIVVPAFVGLGAPYWNDSCRGAIYGINRGTSRADITKATLESLAYQSKDVLDAMMKDADVTLESLKVDGGACANNYLMQFQSDMIQTKIVRSKVLETTAKGAAYLAGLAVGYWKDMDEIKNMNQDAKVFAPNMNQEEVEKRYKKWQEAIKATMMMQF